MKILAKPWTRKELPKRILAIRLQAMGDVIIALPYLQALRNSLPHNTEIDFLTRKEFDAVPRSIELFNRIFSIGGGRNFKRQFVLCLLMLPKILWRRYDVVIDLQCTSISRLVRKFVAPKAWSEFDKTSPVAAGERTRLTIEATQIGYIGLNKKFTIRSSNADDLLKKNGWKNENALVVLNPAGAFESRNWPIENYARFAQLWLQDFPQTQFLMMGVDLIADKATYLESILGDKLINLVRKTNPAEAFAIIQKTSFVLSEDSGLMHFAWVSGIPTFALFGSSRSDWSRPLGEHTLFLDSSDLPCGNCFMARCKYGDTHCLTRYTAEFVFEKAKELLSSTRRLTVLE